MCRALSVWVLRPCYQHRAARGALEQRDQLEHRALARPRASGQEHHLAVVDAETYVGKRLTAVAVAFADAVKDDHAPPAASAAPPWGPSMRAAAKASASNSPKSSARLAHADVADRQLQCLGDRQHDAALGGAVELGERKPGDAHRLVELASLRERVLSLIRIEHQQHFVRRGGIDTLEHPLHLLQLLHQVRLAVQSPGGVGEHDIAAARLGRLQGIKYHRARVSAGQPERQRRRRSAPPIP